MDQEINEDLTNVTFEELLKIRDKLGTKIYRQTVLKPLQQQQQQKQVKSNEQQLDKEHSKKRPIPKRRKKKPNEPVETSSKHLGKNNNFNITTMDDKNKFHDPRFDKNIGEYRQDKFQQNYHFLNEMKLNELNYLKKLSNHTNNIETKEKCQFLIKRIKNQLINDEKLANEKLLKKKSLKNNQNQKQQQQKRRLNNSQMKRYLLIEKFKALKQSGKLNKYLERKRKKLANKDRKKLLIE